MRILRIIYVLVYYGLEEVVLKLNFLRPVRFIFYLFPWNWLVTRKQPFSVRVRLALEDLGPIFVKFGQMLSTRPDLLPQDLSHELSKLQDDVPPFPGKQARNVIEKSFNKKIQDIFTDFSDEPFASASVAQVHCAKLNNKKVIVKVLRPGIESVIRRDLDVMYAVAKIIQSCFADGERLRPTEVVSEYEKIIFKELNLVREAFNAKQLKENFSGSRDLYVPEVYWEYTSENVLVMEQIFGIQVNDIKNLKKYNINFQKLSERGVEIFFTQVFVHNFFHADMHPGNVFVSYDNPEDPMYCAVDFGIMGSLSVTDQKYLAENFLAFFNRDYRRVAELHIQSGWVPSDTPIDEFELAICAVCEPIFQKPLNEISFGHLLLNLFDTARKFNMEVQPQLVLLQKTLLNIEGLGRELYPQLDLWKTAKPFLEKWMQEQIGVKGVVNELKRDIPYFLDNFPELRSIASSFINSIDKFPGDISALPIIEETINSYICIDVDLYQKLGILEGKVIAIEVTPLSDIFYFFFKNNQVEVKINKNNVHADIFIKGSPILLSKAMFSSASARSMNGIEIRGDAEVARIFSELLSDINIDWEEYFSQYIGDVAAYNIGLIFAELNNWAKHAKNSFVDNLSDYITEETDLLPSKEDIENFISQVDQLRDSIDRLDARLNSFE